MLVFSILHHGTGTDVSDKDAELYKGLFYELSPLVITLAILVILQNLVVAWDNFKRRDTLAPAIFTGIALGDILFAQGVIVLSLISILVFRGVLDEEALYKAQFYFMITAIPGLTCSKLYNVLLSVSLSFNLADPFRVLNIGVIKLSSFAATGLFACLHISDAICSIIAYTSYQSQLKSINPFVCLAVLDGVPGGLTTALLYCLPPSNGISRCGKEFEPAATIFAVSTILLNDILPVLTVLVCMVIQARILFRKSTETRDPIFRRAAVTIFLVSSLFFICHISYISGVVFYAVYYGLVYGAEQDQSRPSLLHQGELIALTRFILPLLNSFFYPLILILRKPKLRERYLGYLQRVMSVFRRPRETDVEPLLDEPLLDGQ